MRDLRLLHFRFTTPPLLAPPKGCRQMTPIDVWMMPVLKTRPTASTQQPPSRRGARPPPPRPPGGGRGGGGGGGGGSKRGQPPPPPHLHPRGKPTTQPTGTLSNPTPPVAPPPRMPLNRVQVADTDRCVKLAKFVVNVGKFYTTVNNTHPQSALGLLGLRWGVQTLGGGVEDKSHTLQ